MKKLYVVVLSLLLGVVSAQADSSKVFQPMDGVEKGCKLAKFAGGKWTVSSEQDLSGQTVTAVSISKANADFSNFKYSGAWYAAKNECLKDSAGGDSSSASSDSSSPNDQNNANYFIDVKLQKYLMMGSNTGAVAAATVSGITTASSAYTSGIGFAGRFGYLWKNNKYFILDISDLSASQTITYTNAFTGTPQVSDTILKFNVGLQTPIFSPFWGLNPYASFLVGYAKLSGTFQGTVSGGNLGVSYSAGSIDATLEAGITKEFSRHWDALFSVGFTYLSLSPTISQVNNGAALGYTVGSAMPSRGYSHLTAALGARYVF